MDLRLTSLCFSPTHVLTRLFILEAQSDGWLNSEQGQGHGQASDVMAQLSKPKTFTHFRTVLCFPEHFLFCFRCSPIDGRSTFLLLHNSHCICIDSDHCCIISLICIDPLFTNYDQLHHVIQISGLFLFVGQVVWSPSP